MLLAEAEDVQLRAGEVVHDLLVEAMVVVLQRYLVLELGEGNIHQVIAEVPQELEVELRFVPVQIDKENFGVPLLLQPEVILHG
jgi:hypothetical protein